MKQPHFQIIHPVSAMTLKDPHDFFFFLLSFSFFVLRPRKKNCVKLRETIENEPKMFFYASNSKQFLCGLIVNLTQHECSRTLIGMDFYVLWKLTSPQ